MHAKIENGAVTTTTYNLRIEFPNTSFPAELPDLYEPSESVAWRKVTGTPQVPEFHRLTQTNVVLVDGLPVAEYVYEEIAGTKLKCLTEERERAIVEGVPIFGNVRLSGDVVTIARLDGALRKAARQPDHVFEWSVNGEKFQLTGEQLIAVDEAGQDYVQYCFNAFFVTKDKLSTLNTANAIQEDFRTSLASLLA